MLFKYRLSPKSRRFYGHHEEEPRNFTTPVIVNFPFRLSSEFTFVPFGITYRRQPTSNLKQFFTSFAKACFKVNVMSSICNTNSDKLSKLRCVSLKCLLKICHSLVEMNLERERDYGENATFDRN